MPFPSLTPIWGREIGSRAKPTRSDPAAEIVAHKINVLIIARRHDRGGPIGPTHYATPSTNGIQADGGRVVPGQQPPDKNNGGQAFPGPGSAAILDRLVQPLHDEFDGLRREVAPDLELRQKLLLGVSLEIFPYCSPGSRVLPGELLADERVLRHGAIEAQRGWAGNRPIARSKKWPQPLGS